MLMSPDPFLKYQLFPSCAILNDAYIGDPAYGAGERKGYGTGGWQALALIRVINKSPVCRQKVGSLHVPFLKW
jgi:hypothetical protein